MKPIILLTLMIAFFGCERRSLLTLDFSAVKPYFEIEALLRDGKIPTDSLWNALISTPGYHILCEREFKQKWMKSYIYSGIAKDSSYKIDLWKTKKFWDVKFLEHHKEVSENRTAILQFIDTLKNDEMLAIKANELVYSYLPDAINYDEKIPVSFLFFDKDARGYSPIVIDLLYARQLYHKGQLAELIAHEMHHFIRDKYTNFKYPDEESADYNVLWAIDQIHKEGLADQIDKDKRFKSDPNEKYTIRFKKVLVHSYKYFHRFDSLMVAYYKSGENLSEIAKQIRRSVPLSGHPMGYYMAKALINEGYEKEMINSFNDPYTFFELYQKVSNEKKNYVRLSDETLKLIYKTTHLN